MRKYITRLEQLIVFISLGFILGFIILAVVRMFYPFELEWIEGAYLDQVRWLADGNSLFTQPSIEFIPTNKTPIFFYISAFFLRIMGVGFTAPRLVSTLSAICCFLLLFLITKKETGKAFPAIIAAGIYAASFQFTGTWMDLAKTDSVFLFFILLAFYIGRNYPNSVGFILSGLTFVLAFYTKQLTLPIILVLAPMSLITSRGRTWLQWIITGFFGLAIFFLLDSGSDGWFSFYTLETTSYHQVVFKPLSFWDSFLKVMWPACILGLFYPAFHIIRDGFARFIRFNNDNFWHNLGFGSALILASWSVFFKVWTFDNGFMPACAGVGLLAGFGYHQLSTYFNDRTTQSNNKKTTFLIAGIVLTLTQYLLLLYNPFELVPTKSDKRAGESYIQRLKYLNGEVLTFNQGFVNNLAGKKTYFHSAPFGDVAGGIYPPRNDDFKQRKKMVLDVFSNAIESQLFDWVILNKPQADWSPYYLYVDNLFDNPNLFYPVTGARSRPESLLIKNPVSLGGKYPLDDTQYDVFFLEGWSEAQPQGRWVTSSQSILQISLEEDHSYQLIIKSEPACIEHSPIVSTLEIIWNDQRLHSKNITTCQQYTFRVTLPEELISGNLDYLKFTSYPQASENDDNKKLLDSKLLKLSSMMFVQD